MRGPCVYVDNFFIAWPRKKQHKNSHSRIEILEFFHYNSDLSLYSSRKQSSSCCLIFYITKLKRRNSKILGTFSYIEIWVQPIHTCCNQETPHCDSGQELGNNISNSDPYLRQEQKKEREEKGTRLKMLLVPKAAQNIFVMTRY